MNKKIFLVTFVLTFFITGVFLFLNIANSAGDARSNAICWTKSDCAKARQNSTEGFILDEETCPGYAQEGVESSKWGKCLPGSVTTAQVSFGGTTKFANIGEYIKTIYNYALVMLAILASVMIIVAGIQYVGSAGSQEMITSAKKKILGAIIGLAIAYMSYTVLSMVNPNTVNLRLPQVYMIRPSVVVVEPGDFCDATPGSESAKACENNTKGNVRYYCTAIALGSRCGLGDERSCPCAKAAEFMAETAVFLAMGGGEAIAEGIVNMVSRKALAKAAQPVAEQITLKSVGSSPAFTTALEDAMAMQAEQAGVQVTKETIKATVSEAASGKTLLDIIKIGGKYIWTGGKVFWNGTKWTVKTTAKAGAVAGAGGAVLETNAWVMGAIDNLAIEGKILPGKCIAMSLPEGALCDMDKNPCAEGRCISFSGGIGSFQCWSGNSEIGVCSSGKVNSFCNTNSDCASSNDCVAFVSIGGKKVMACSDGSFGAPCDSSNPDFCYSKKCLNGYCIRKEAQMTKGASCIDNTECEGDLRCYTLVPGTLTYSSDETINYSGAPVPTELSNSNMQITKQATLQYAEAGSNVYYDFVYDFSRSTGVCLTQGDFNINEIKKYGPNSKWSNPEKGTFSYPLSLGQY